MLKRTSPAVALLSVAALASGQGLVNRTTEWNVDHEVATGFDSVGGSSISDFIQRGMALGDIDGDGDLDAIFCGGVLPNTVLRNDGGVFSDITAQAGIDVGDFDTVPCLADYDGDGDLDLFIGVVEKGGFGFAGRPSSRFYRNDGTGTFEEITTLAWTRGSGYSIFAQWADMDLDGLVDLLVSEFYTVPNLYYRNNGDGTFTDVSVASGLDTPGSTHATCVLDANGDGYLDVFVGNDYIASNWPPLPNNSGDVCVFGQGDGTWVDHSLGSGNDHKRGIMGFAIGDVDYDGDFDLYKTDVEDNRLVINQGWPASGVPYLGEEQEAYGIACDLMDWPGLPGIQGKIVSWGTAFVDLDFDLWLDLIVINGKVGGCNPTKEFSPRNQPNFLYTGNGPGAGFTFSDSTSALGFYDEIDDRGLALGDVDQDGDIDIFVTAAAGKVRFFENQIDPAGQGWLMVKPVTQTSAAGGFGVEVEFTDSLGYPHRRLVGLDGPTASQHDNFAYFGLGNEPSVDLTVSFPSGIELSLPGLTPNQVIHPVEPKLVEVSAYTLPIGPNPRLAGSRGAPTGAGGPAELLAVTAYAHDQAGNPLDGGAAVTIEVPGLAPTTDVLHLGGNVFRRYFAAPATPGEVRAEVAFDGWACRIRPRVWFYDPSDASGTSAEVVPEAVRAGSADTFQVIVAPKDASGISLESGDAVDIQIAGVAPLDGIQDLGDGRYRATFPAPSSPGITPITVLHEGGALPLGLQIEAGGAATASGSTLTQDKPYEKTAVAPWQLRVLLIPRDQSQLRLGPYTDAQIVAVPSPGTEPVTVRADLHPEGQPDGSFPFVIEKPNTSPPTAVSGTLEVWIDGVKKANVVYSF